MRRKPTKGSGRETKPIFSCREKSLTETAPKAKPTDFQENKTGVHDTFGKPFCPHEIPFTERPGNPLLKSLQNDEPFFSQLAALRALFGKSDFNAFPCSGPFREFQHKAPRFSFFV